MNIKKLVAADVSAQAALTRKLIDASSAYYAGDPVMSDHEFDLEVERLQEMERESGFAFEGSPSVAVGASIVTELKKVTHEMPALSLDKVKYKDRAKLMEWCDGQDVAISWKLDGLTVVATYDDGHLVSAVTRGNGVEGSDITHNAVFFKGLPVTIPYKEHLVVRGEALMSFSEFERINDISGGIYENPRNLAAATIQMLDSNESRKREIEFFAFELVYPFPERDAALLFEDDISLSARYFADRGHFMEILGFQVVPYKFANSSNILEKIEEWKSAVSELAFPTDGLVITYEDLYEGWSLGSTGHHPRWSIALKWTDETVRTTIRDIEWSVGKTGQITPVAIFDEVRLGAGSNVTRASLHNLSILDTVPDEDGNPVGVHIGCKARVYLANMIIPQIASVSSDGMPIEIPKVCPVCGEPVAIKVSDSGVRNLFCENEKCSARQIGKLMNTFGKDGLFVKGLGESQLADLIAVKLIDDQPASLYEMNEYVEHTNPGLDKYDLLLEKDGWGEKKWQNLIDAIEASRKTTLQRFLYSLNIPLLGKDLSKKLSEIFHGDVNEFLAFFQDPKADWLMEHSGIGEEKAGNVVSWCQERNADLFETQRLKDLIGHLAFETVSAKAKQSLSGMTFVITGAVHDYKNRDEFKSSVEARGGKVAGSVSKKTNFLVNNDITSTSGKNAKAKELGIPIISEDEFIERFGR